MRFQQDLVGEPRPQEYLWEHKRYVPSSCTYKCDIRLRRPGKMVLAEDLDEIRMLTAPSTVRKYFPNSV